MRHFITESEILNVSFPKRMQILHHVGFHCQGLFVFPNGHEETFAVAFFYDTQYNQLVFSSKRGDQILH